MNFRTRLFVASLLASAVTLLVGAALVSWSVQRIVDGRIERSLIDEARLASETLSHRQAATPGELDAEADALGRLIAARVTFVARDGTVVGDSEVSTADLATLENHGTRPEIVQARRDGVGIARRYSATLKIEMLYVAVEVPGATTALSEVRLAMPLTEISEQLAGVRHSSLVAMTIGLMAAVGVAWGASSLLSRRVRAIADMAERYAAGDLTPSRIDYGTDEIGVSARLVEDSIREIGNRATQRESDRARMEAILNGMSEGVLVVTPQGRLQFVNGAARRMLKVEDAPEGLHYLEIARHPDIAGEINAALHGLSGGGRELTLGGDGNTTFIARGAPVASGAGRGAVLVLHDITELRKADRIRRDFVANVSHELRTPLTAIKGYAEALLDDPEDAETRERFLDIIHRHATRMERLVRDLLRLARLDAGQEIVEYAPCDVEALLRGIANDFEPAAAQKQQTISTVVTPDAK